MIEHNYGKKKEFDISYHEDTIGESHADEAKLVHREIYRPLKKKIQKAMKKGTLLLPQRYHNILDRGLELLVSQAHFQSDLAALSTVGVHGQESFQKQPLFDLQKTKCIQIFTDVRADFTLQLMVYIPSLVVIIFLRFFSQKVKYNNQHSCCHKVCCVAMRTEVTAADHGRRARKRLDTTFKSQISNLYFNTVKNSSGFLLHNYER